MALDSYTGLKAALADTLERDDLTSQIDDFIDLAEARHKREIRIREMITRSALTVDDRYVALPTGFLEGLSLRLLTDPVTLLKQLSPFEMTNERQETTGRPRFFTIHTQLEFDRFPDATYSGEILYYKAQTALGSGQASNDILARAPDLYLYGALIAATPHIMHDERLPVWTSLYNNARDAINAMDQKARRIGPQMPRVFGRPDTAGRR